MSKLLSTRGHNDLHTIDDLPFSDDNKELVLEYLAQKLWRLLLDTGIQDGHCKGYDPMIIEGNVAHTYVFNLGDGGRHHDFKNLAELEQRLMDDFKTWVKEGDEA